MQDWEMKTVGDVVVFQGGSQPPKKYFSPENKEGYVRLIQIRDYKTDNFKTYIPLEKAKKFCTKDDIMIGRYGPPIFQILRGIEGAYNVALIKATPTSDILKEYLYYFLSTEPLFNLIDSLSQRTSGQTGIDMEALKEYPFPIPPKKEQKKIANILSSLDEQIELTDQLIEKTKKLKKGLLQKLLTKGIRGNGNELKETKIGQIPSNWNLLKLEELVEIRSGCSPSKITFENTKYAKFPFFKVNDMNFTTKFLSKSKLYFNKANIPLMEKGMVVFPKRGAAIFTNKIALLSQDSLFDTNIMGLKCLNRNINNEYLFYYLMFIGLEKVADTSSIPQINNKHINPLLISVPPLEEQQKIVEVLSTVDNTVDNYSYKREKLQQLKLGLMQNLLNGKIRVEQ